MNKHKLNKTIYMTLSIVSIAIALICYGMGLVFKVQNNYDMAFRLAVVALIAIAYGMAYSNSYDIEKVKEKIEK